jgi:lysophospholipase L1-like esterase
MNRWVTTWGCALQPPDGDDDPDLSGAILRQTVRATVGGDAAGVSPSSARLRLSNEYGRTPLRVVAAAVARPDAGRAGVSRVVPGSSIALTFRGAASVTIPPRGTATTDPFVLPLAPRTNLAVTLQLEPGCAIEGITTHPGSRTTSYVVAGHAVPPDQRPDELIAEPELKDAVPVAHWYLLSALEVRPDALPSPGEPAPAVAVLLGDSLTDGRGSTTDGNDRWPDQLIDRLHEREGLTHLGFVNQAAGGNRVLRDGLGIAALARLERDVLACAGVAWLILFEGVNDIGTALSTMEAQRRVGDELIGAYGQIIDRAHAHGIRVYGSTLTPFAGNSYDDAAGVREATRQRVNAWIRDSRRFDEVIDFDAAVRRPDDPARVRPGLHVGDGLHLNRSGYRALAAAVPATLFGTP